MMRREDASGNLTQAGLEVRKQKLIGNIGGQV
jgi:hypothetical protein